jgi:hypothetical protein
MKMKDTLHPLAYASGFLLVFIKNETDYVEYLGWACA